MPNESALKDGNRVPTLLFEQNGETRRVSVVNPLPVHEVGDLALLKTVTREIATNQGIQTILTPAAGKKLVIKGCAVVHEPATGGEGILRFQGGQLVFKTYRSDHSGNFISMNLSGNVDEPLVGQIPSGTGGNRAFFLVNYVEE